ncbi:MAG: ABC transporter ATP-binding protein/permease [Eubacteriales bacterium]|nr:ABC transporter ATP-binding protein/permease [Eubacteriales bacterium]
MLQIKNISKKYTVGGIVTKALDDVSLNLRDNEFVAILGPSGSGKTTLLNIVGGLDRYDSGDLIIGDISTKKYKDRDWDSYRNHTIGFVFQSYNLIEHQTVLANVELALTIGGISKKERKKRAKQALIDVGLKDHIKKKPNQLSGGQMQRVAIARALVNNPDILLADEPTGALDSETSVQVMELLKEVAKDRLVVMVTHNPELAQEYATRIVNLKDGKIISDSNEYIVEDKAKENKHKNMGKSSMSFFTAMSLSFKNLMTKKGRTILTSFAGSIGIIGIALILAFSNGVNRYIQDIQRDTMSSYPISITKEAFDLTSIMEMRGKTVDTGIKEKYDDKVVNAGYKELELSDSIYSSVTKNDLELFKEYLDDPDSDIHKYLGENGIVYTYDVNFSVFSYDENDEIINSNADTEEIKTSKKSDGGLMDMMQTDMTMMTNMYTMAANASESAPNFQELMRGNDTVISKVITDSYDMLYGEWPDKYNEVVLILDRSNAVSADKLYQLGFITGDEFQEICDIIQDGEEPEEIKWDYEKMCEHNFYMVPLCDQYVKNDNGTFTYIGEDESKYDDMIEDALELNIVGVIKPLEDAANATVPTPIGYTSLLTDYIIEHTDKSDIIKAQESDPDTNVLNNMPFEAKTDKDKIKDAKKYIKNLPDSDKATFYQAVMYFENEGEDSSAIAMSLGSATGTNYSAYAMAGATDYNAMMATMLDSWLDNDPDKDILLSVYDEYIDGASYENNLTSFGKVSYDSPSSISIYADTFEDKDSIAACIESYNKKADEESKITYTDYIALLTSSITSIVDVVSYVLIAFVAVSLIVSSIMIGIITYISVLERTKEIGILRAIGASKRNISQVFNAETFIIGLCSGVMGILISLLILIPSNALIRDLSGIENINASIPPVAAIILIVLSVILTTIGGLIPSKKAAKKDPVTALRSE